MAIAKQTEPATEGFPLQQLERKSVVSYSKLLKLI